MAKADTTKTTTKTTTKRRVPTAVNLLIYLEDYIEAEDIGSDLSLSVVFDRLNNSILTEAKQRARG